MCCPSSGHGLLEQQVEAGFDDGERIRSVKEYYSWTILNMLSAGKGTCLGGKRSGVGRRPACTPFGKFSDCILATRKEE